jgi:hypothetical protein
MDFILHFQNCTNDARKNVSYIRHKSTHKVQDNLKLQFSLDVLIQQ